MDFALPVTPAEWLPFGAAGFTALLGLLALLAPRLVLRLAPLERESKAVAEGRSLLAGMLLGEGLFALLLYNQPMVQLGLGAAWVFAAFGRLVSLLSDGVAGLYDWLMLLVALLVALAALAPQFGLVPA